MNPYTRQKALDAWRNMELRRGRKVLVMNSEGSTVQKMHKSGLVSITPVHGEKIRGMEFWSVWINEETP